MKLSTLYLLVTYLIAMRYGNVAWFVTGSLVAAGYFVLMNAEREARDTAGGG